MTKICFAFNHLQYSDGIAKSAIGIANYISSNYDIEIILRPIYKYEKGIEAIINDNVVIQPVFGFFFHGMSKIINRLPKNLLHKIIFGNNNYNIEIGFQHGTSTIAVVSNKKNDGSKHYIWMHGYDEGLTMLPYFKKADKVVCVSKYNADRLIKESNNTVPATYSYNLIDEKKVIENSKEEISIPRSEAIAFVSVGRHSKEKGYKRLVNVLAKLKKSGYSFSLWLIGDGPEHYDLMEQVRGLGMEDTIFFLGAQENPHKYTAKADVFICSSYNEGYSTACTEAIMLGVPIITTNVSGANEIIREAKSGTIVENSDDGLFNGIKSILDNPSQIDEWKDTLLVTKNNFSIGKRAERLVSLLELNEKQNHNLDY